MDRHTSRILFGIYIFQVEKSLIFADLILNLPCVDQEHPK